MKSATIVIPSYWGPAGGLSGGEEEIIFDHPTPLNEEGTLGWLLDSFELVNTQEFKVVVVVVANASHITNEVIAKVQDVVEPYRAHYDIALLHSQNLNRLRRALIHDGVPEAACELINLDSYPAVRNMCSLAGILNGSEITIFLDDDEAIIDSKFLSKAQEFIGSEYQGQEIKAVAGYYLQPDSYRLDVSGVPAWRRPYWNNASAMNEAFELIIGRPPRLKPTPFIFGGNMVLHHDTVMKVPFDPLITRGEDIDFLINLRINRITLWLDRELYIKHVPPKIFRPAWRSLREDIKRFLYERKKVIDHEEIEGVGWKELMPYPGTFLGPDLEERIIRTNELLKEEYKKLSDKRGMDECEVNIELAKNNPFKDIDTPTWLRNLIKRWQGLTHVAVGRGIPK
ncbi:hypothetical protein ES703_99907 [subsurface metagenome]